MAKLDYRADVDGLRAVAVLPVLLFHAQLGAPGGYTGVDVFFVISGFLITSLILKDLRAGSFSFQEFWVRRIRRILPALAAVVLAVAVVGWFAVLPETYLTMAKHVLYLVFCSSNIKFHGETGYFATDSEEKPLLHTWSLSVEEQFYLLIPVCLFLLFRLGRSRWVVPFLVAGCLGSFGLTVYWTWSDPSAAFYLIPSRAWELGVGSLLAFAGRIPNARVRSLASWGGSVLLLASFFLYPEGIAFPGLAALPPVAGAALLIWAGFGRSPMPLPNRVLTLKPLVWTGLISYSLYLWHWPVFAFQKYLGYPSEAAGVQIGLLAIGFVLAWLSWKFIEEPFRKGPLLRSRGRALGFGGGCAACALVGGFAVLHGGGMAGRFSDQIEERQLLEFGHLPYVEEVEASALGSSGPFVGDPHSELLVYLWGDSHAMAILPAVVAACDGVGAVCYRATRSGTPPLLGDFQRVSGNPARVEWERGQRPWNRAVIDDIRSKVAGSRRSVVVLHGIWRSYVRVEGFERALAETIGELRRAGVSRVVLIRHCPTFREFEPRQFYEPVSVFHAAPAGVRELEAERDRPYLVDVESHLERRRELDAIYSKLDEAFVVFVDPAAVLPTSGGRFTPFIAGPGGETVPIFRDASHLNVRGALLFEESLTEVLRGDPAGAP